MKYLPIRIRIGSDIEALGVEYKPGARVRELSELEVSDVYVRLGNDFNAAVAAFTSFNIDMS